MIISRNKIARFCALVFVVAPFQNGFAAKASSGEDAVDADNLVLLAHKEFSVWLKEHPYQKDKHKIDLKLLCGREFGEPCKWLSDNIIITGGSGAEILVPFPPFKQMHCLYGSQPGHPMDWCHFGRYPKVEPDALTINGDYENEARLLKERFEQLFGITMLPLHQGQGFVYNDGYNSLTIKLDAKSYQGSITNLYPLVVDVWDLELDRQNRQMQDIYRKIKQAHN